MLSTVEAQAGVEDAVAREFEVRIERIKAVVLSGQIQHPQEDFAAAMKKPVAKIEVVLEKIIARKRRGIAGVVLRIPLRLRAREEARWLLGERVELCL